MVQYSSVLVQVCRALGLRVLSIQLAGSLPPDKRMLIAARLIGEYYFESLGVFHVLDPDWTPHYEPGGTATGKWSRATWTRASGAAPCRAL